MRWAVWRGRFCSAAVAHCGALEDCSDLPLSTENTEAFNMSEMLVTVLEEHSINVTH